MRLAQPPHARAVRLAILARPFQCLAKGGPSWSNLALRYLKHPAAATPKENHVSAAPEDSFLIEETARPNIPVSSAFHLVMLEWRLKVIHRTLSLICSQLDCGCAVTAVSDTLRVGVCGPLLREAQRAERMVVELDVLRETDST